jgi:hypothetical protein
MGVNDTLNATGGWLYVPLKARTSGELGDGGRIGLFSDAVTMGTGQRSAGAVNFTWGFDLSDEFGATAIDPDTAQLVLMFRDMDFRPINVNGLIYAETLGLEFLRDAADAAAGPDLVLDDTNYGNYRADGFGATKRTDVTYTFHLRDDLGLTPEDFDALNVDKEFGMSLTIGSTMAYRGAGTITFTNTREQIDPGQFAAFGVPEPLTMATMATGMGLLWLRRRTRR